MAWAPRFLLALPLLLGVGCRATPPPAQDPDGARIRELEDRVAWLEEQAKAATLVEDEILALEVRRAGLLVTYEPSHPAILDLDRKIQALEKVRVLECRVRRQTMCERLEIERDRLLTTYTHDHDSVRRLDAQIAFLRSDAG